KLAPFLEGHTLGGPDMVMTGDANFRGKKADARGRFQIPSLTVAGPMVATSSTQLQSIAITLGAASAKLPNSTEVYSLNSFQLKASGDMKADGMAINV